MTPNYLTLLADARNHEVLERALSSRVPKHWIEYAKTKKATRLREHQKVKAEGGLWGVDDRRKHNALVKWLCPDRPYDWDPTKWKQYLRNERKDLP